MTKFDIKSKELVPKKFAKPGVQFTLSKNVRNPHSLKGKKITTKVRI